MEGKISPEDFEEDFLIPMNRARAESLFVRAEKRFYEPQHAEEVERNLVALLNSTPNHFGAYILLARFYARRGNEEKERAVVERMIAQFGRRDEVIGLLERELRRSGGEEEVRALRDLLERGG